MNYNIEEYNQMDFLDLVDEAYLESKDEAIDFPERTKIKELEKN